MHNGVGTIRTASIACIALASLVGGAGAHVPVPLAPPSTPEAAPSPRNIEAGFTVYVGGFLLARGRYKARLEGDAYRLDVSVTTAGAPAALYEAEFNLLSEGDIAEARIRPRRYMSDARGTRYTRKVTLDYDGNGMPHLSATPPYEPGDLTGTMPSQRIATQDPISAVLVPVVGGGNPCDRSIPIFDGRRRYDLKLTDAGTTSVTPQSADVPAGVVVCNVRYVPLSPVEKRKFTDMLRRNDDTKIWLAPFDGGRVYLPVRLQLRTPLGGAVAEIERLDERGGPGRTTARN